MLASGPITTPRTMPCTARTPLKASGLLKHSIRSTQIHGLAEVYGLVSLGVDLPVGPPKCRTRCSISRSRRFDDPGDRTLMLVEITARKTDA